MRPLELAVQGFGCFVSPLVLDFRTLGQCSLFLIHGATGAGKTTLLDAICFALFGKTSGSDRRERAVRSHYADDSLPTEVRFSFTLGARTYRVVRRPEQVVARKRGGGTRVEPARAELWEVREGTDRLVASRMSEVSAEIVRLMGLGVEQFRQVILLPQGEFRRLLTAPMEERRAILETLFRTDRFGVLEEVLRQKEREAREQAQEITLEIKALMQHYAVADREALAARQVTTGELCDRAKTKRDQLAALLTAKSAELRAADSAHRRYQEYVAERQTLEQLEAARPKMTERRQRVLRAERGEVLRGKAAALEKTRQVRDEAECGLRELRTLLERERERLRAAAVDEAQSAKAALGAFECELGRLRAEREQTAAALARNESLLSEKRLRLVEARAALLAAQASRLAAELREGEPCPVCGATGHPAPAAQEASEMTEARVAALESELKRLDEQTGELRRESGRLTAAVEERGRALGEFKEEAGAAAEQARDEPKSGQDLKQALERFREQRGRREAFEREWSTAQTREQERAAALESAEAKLLEEQERFGQAVTRHGFSDRAEFEASLLEPDALACERQAVAEFEAQIQASEARLKLFSETAAPAAVDMRPLEQELLRLNGESERAITELLAAQRKRDDLQNAERQLGELEVRLEAAERRYAVRAGVSQLCRGENPRRLSFHSFVLSVLLDEVLVAASRRLYTMMRGRYELRREQRVLDRRPQSGLDLVVYDSYTGQERECSTLSGGESFAAALALALGLAEVVQSWSGGVKLETMFIDEGFGSLDPDSLDQVFTALRDLEQRGRLVGIISHVPELKERIDVRLEVTAGVRGSTARFVVP